LAVVAQIVVWSF